MSFNMIDFIEKKRDGGRHTKAEFDALDAQLKGEAAQNGAL